MNKQMNEATERSCVHDIAMTINRSAAFSFAVPALSTYLTLAAASTVVEFMGVKTNVRSSGHGKSKTIGTAGTKRQSPRRNALWTLEHQQQVKL